MPQNHKARPTVTSWCMTITVSVAAEVRLGCKRGSIKSWQVFGSGGEGIISVEVFGGEKWRFGVTVCKGWQRMKN